MNQIEKDQVDLLSRDILKNANVHISHDGVLDAIDFLANSRDL